MPQLKRTAECGPTCYNWQLKAGSLAAVIPMHCRTFSSVSRPCCVTFRGASDFFSDVFTLNLTRENEEWKCGRRRGSGSRRVRRKALKLVDVTIFFENERVDGRSNGVSLFFLKTLRTDRGIA
jgi:hypothetical protein